MADPTVRPIKIATMNLARAVRDHDPVAEQRARESLTAAKIEHAIVSALTTGAALTDAQRVRLSGLLLASGNEVPS